MSNQARVRLFTCLLLLILLALFLLPSRAVDEFIPLPVLHPLTEPQESSLPAAESFFVETYENLPISGTFPMQSFSESSSRSFRITEKPQLGEVRIDGNAFTFIPYLGCSGDDRFCYTATDAAGTISPTGTVSIRIKPREKESMIYADMEGDPAHYAAIRLAEEGVFRGEQVGEYAFFRPDAPVTRAEFLAMVCKAADLPVLPGARRSVFADHNEIAQWIRPAVCTAYDSGLILGKETPRGRVFRAQDPITHAEAAVMLCSADGGEVITTSATFEESCVPAWAQSAVSALAARGVLDQESFHPDEVLSRRKAALLLCKVMEETPEPRNEFSLFSFWNSLSEISIGVYN